ncbi:MAG: RNA polymerase sigma factor [Pseudonocardia sp.]|nr:RNA polymerase sigma factor [Pseudonocardia sp.]
MCLPTVTVRIPAQATRLPYPDLANEDLLHLAGRGDQQAWAEIVRRYRRLVASVVRSYRLQEADACDAEQRTWLRLVEHRASVRDPLRLGGWLATTASRECLRLLRDNRYVVSDEMESLPDPRRGVEQTVIDADTTARIWGIVAVLPPRSRTIMQALFADGAQPYADVARTTGIPVGSLGPTRARVLSQVRRALDGGGLSVGDRCVAPGAVVGS